MDPLMKIDGNKVRELRERRAWSQEHLAAACGLSVRTVQRVEREGSGLPETRLALASALGVAAEDLMGATPKPAPGHDIDGAVSGAKWGWLGWGAGVTCSLTGIFLGFLGHGSWPEALRGVGVVGALAGICAGLIAALGKRRGPDRTTV